MSRIGKTPIAIPADVTVALTGRAVTLSGEKGSLSLPLAGHVSVTHKDNTLAVRPNGNSKLHRAMWGTVAALIKSAITGVTKGHSHTLELIGVGYRVSVEAGQLIMILGFSHDVRLPIPDSITARVGGDRNRPLLTLQSYDKQALGQFTATIRRLRPPEPYKGKGIKFVGEIIRRKEGKRK